MTRETNITRVLDAYCYSNFYGFHKNDRIRITEDYEIYDTHTLMGKIESVYNKETDTYKDYLILTLQDFKSQPSWKKHKMQLAKMANKYGLRVIFVPELDIGFAISPVYNIDMKKLIDLIKLVPTPEYPIPNYQYMALIAYCNDEVVALTYTQCLEGEYIKAEEIITDYLDKGQSFDFTVSCLSHDIGIRRLIECGAHRIFYLYGDIDSEMKASSSFAELVDKLNSGQIRCSANNCKITIKPIICKTIENYYTRRKQNDNIQFEQNGLPNSN